jgi:hypothetical protein
MNPESAASRAFALLGFQVALGAALALWPDTRWPLGAQLLVLVHVVIATASLLALGVGIAFHVRGRVARRPNVPRAAPTVRWLRVVLVLGVAAASLTGVAAARGGEGTPSGDWHAAAGLAVALPLAAHLLFDGRRAARRFGVAFVLVSPLAVPSVRAALRPAPVPVAAVVFSRDLRSPDLYDHAEWCGSCHRTHFNEWKHSTHARALAMPEVRRHFGVDIDEGRHAQVDSDLRSGSREGEQHCVQCHAPLTFYADEPRPVMEDARNQTQGVSCVFCHTLRGLEKPGGLYTSAPETVRRYLGQNADRLLARSLGDLLIRWRPEVHRRDYRTELLGQSMACAGCHDVAFQGWEASSYAGAVPSGGSGAAELRADAVTCQECHMATAPGGRQSERAEPIVPWGAPRTGRHHHGWPGGNVRGSLAFDDEHGARITRWLREGMVELRILEVRREAPDVRVTVVMRNEKAGHHYPSGEGGDARDQWLQLELLDAEGRLLDTSVEPDSKSQDFDQRERTGLGIPLVHQRAGAYPEERLTAEKDTRVPPNGEQTFRLALRDQPGVARVRVSIRSSFDPLPILHAEAGL